MSTIFELIKNTKSYNQPIEWRIVDQIYKTDKPTEDYKYFYWKVLEENENYKLLYDLLDDYYKNYSEIKKLVLKMALEETKKIERFRVLRNGKIIDNNNYIEEVPEGLFRCSSCGNIYDGFAQCYCNYSYLIYFD